MPTVAVLTEPGQMTVRARWYLSIAATRHLLTGSVAFVSADSFKSTSFIPILSAAPLRFWALVFVGAGLACAAAAIWKSETLARLGMAWSATSTLIIAVAFLIAFFTGSLASFVGLIIWFAIAAKDYVVCAQPIRSPFEGLAERVAKRSNI